MNILDLDPSAFAAALDELGFVGEQRDALIAQYSDPSRGYQRDERPFLTRLGDNIIGFDDGVETQGERIGQGVRTFFDAVREDPLGVAGDMVSGFYGEIERGVRGELTPTETLGLAPVLSFGSAAARRAEDVVDAAQRAQAARFDAENVPVFPGEPFATNNRGETQFYHPSEDEYFDMLFSPTPSQAEFMQRRDAAEAAIAQGASPADVGSSAILAIPRRTLTGEQYPDRMVAAVTPRGMVALRPERATDYGAQFIDDADLRAGGGYNKNPLGEAPIIAQSPKTSPEERAVVRRHEMTHADLAFGDVPSEEVGTSLASVSAARLDALDTLDRRIREASTPEERQRLMDLREEIRGATSYELYERNPGEMLARLAEGRPTTARALSLTEALNPYLRPNTGFGRRAAESVTQGLIGERSGILSVPTTRLFDYAGLPVNPRLYFDAHKNVPMDLNRAIFAEPDSPFSP